MSTPSHPPTHPPHLDLIQPGILPSSTPEKYLLKIQNGVESATPAVLEFQHEMMNRLHAAGLQCQRPIPLPSSSSSSFIHYQELPVKDGPPTRLAVRLLSWVEGTPLVSMPCTGAALVAAGKYLGRMNKALEGFDHPGAHREHMWDVKNIKDLRTWTQHVQDPARRALIHEILEAFDAEVYPAAGAFR